MEKFGYSLLLSRYEDGKIDPSKAQTVVQAAFTGGVIPVNADNALMRHDANYQFLWWHLNSTEGANQYLTNLLIT
jgi:hypothetical protein